MKDKNIVYISPNKIWLIIVHKTKYLSKLLETMQECWGYSIAYEKHVL